MSLVRDMLGLERENTVMIPVVFARFVTLVMLLVLFVFVCFLFLLSFHLCDEENTLGAIVVVAWLMYADTA